MYTMNSRLMLSGALFVGTVLSGLILSHFGRPFNSALFSVHKLVALAAVIVVAMIIRQLVKGGETRALVETSLIFVTGATLLSLIVTGSLLSINLQLPPFVLKIHQIAPVLSLVSSAVTILVLIGNRSQFVLSR